MNDVIKAVTRLRPSSLGLRIRPVLIQGPETEALVTSTGSIKPRPEQRSHGLLNILLMVIPSLSIGAYAANKGAGLLEEFEIFVPEDDDDD